MSENENDMVPVQSSDGSLTRQDFIKKIVKGAALTGGLVAAPAILDKFLVPPVYANTSIVVASGCVPADQGQPTLSNGQPDGYFTVFGNLVISCDFNDSSNFTNCSGGGDATLDCG